MKLQLQVLSSKYTLYIAFLAKIDDALLTVGYKHITAKHSSQSVQLYSIIAYYVNVYTNRGYPLARMNHTVKQCVYFAMNLTSLD